MIDSYIATKHEFDMGMFVIAALAEKINFLEAHIYVYKGYFKVLQAVFWAQKEIRKAFFHECI
jgi:hypothetical protein